MNKRFSTLLAAALVAGGLSFNATADSYLPSTVDGGAVKEGVNAYLKAGSDYLSISEGGALKVIASADLSGANLSSALWTIKAIPATTVTGTTYAYQFTNKATGQLLSIELKSNKENGGKDDLKIEAGNSTWGWDATNGLYAVGTKDTTFWIDGTSLKANPKGTATAPTTKITYGEIAATAKIEMKAADFKALVKDGKLYFNGEDVSTGQANILTANKWTAESYNITNGAFAAVGVADANANVLFFTNGQKVAGYDNAKAATTDKKKYLLVDHKFYDAPANVLNVLAVDTLSFDPTATASANTVIDARTEKIGKHHPFAAAFKADYYIANDSIVLTSAYQPASIAVTTTLASLATNLAHTKLTDTGDAFKNLKAAVASFYAAKSTGAAGTDFPAKDATFAESNFATTGYAWQAAATTATTGADLIKKATELVAAAKDATNANATDKATLKAEKEAANAFLDALKGLAIVTPTSGAAAAVAAIVTTDKIKNGANFADGLNALSYQTGDKQIIVRKLSDTKVVTVADKANASNLIALIQPYATKPGIGGDATIAEGLYYIKDMNKLEGEDANEGYGLFMDASPVNAAKYVAEVQAFNPFAQFVVEKAAGVEKGNYVITNRGTVAAEDGFSGVTNVVDKDNKIYAIGIDTIQLVKADDVDADAATIGFKYITNAEAKNNKFTITSAADVLEGYSLVMRSDSSVAVAEADEVLYTLVPSADVKYGFDEELICKTYSIMNADSAYLIEADDKFVFSNGKYGKENGTPAKFSLIAVDSESTYVLACLENGHEGKMVISTQYKTISTEELDHARNDLFFVTPEAAPASYKSLPKHVQIMGVDGNYMAVNSKNQGVAVREGDELKAAYATEDFTFWLDTADYANAETYKYYITKGVKATEETAASRMFLFNAKDSVNVSEANKDLLTYGNNGARAIFRTASILAKDTLLVPQLNTTAKIDTVSSAAGKSVDGLEHKVIATIENFKFAFEYTDNEGEYVIKSNNSFVHNINGVLVMGNEKDALVVNVKAADAPTSNEGVEVSEMTVITGEGNVTIAGAAGKKVVISNILGQVVANTVLSSDNATIAAPQGVVVIAVEGEEAVKAIVK